MGDGSWLIQRVTTESRETFLAGEFGSIRRNDTFTIIVVDDKGPAEMILLPLVDEHGSVIFDVPKRWHVVLLQGALYYFRHDWFETAKLVNGVTNEE